MPRGEPAPPGKRGPGLAIGAAFGVLCLASALLVLSTTRACRGVLGYSAAVGWAPEPFSGADAALVPLGRRDCPGGGGPAVGPGPAGPAATRARLESTTRDRGYVEAAAGWAAPVPLPLRARAEELGGGCGLLAVAAEASAWITRVEGALGAALDACDPSGALIPVCDGDPFLVDGGGLARTRVYLLPGLTPATVDRIGMPLDVLLAHAEAESQLRRMGWQPADEVTRTRIPAGTTSLSPPASPASGCIGWVAVGQGLGHATSWWSTRAVDTEPSPSGFTLGMVACDPASGAAVTETRIDVMDVDGGGGEVWFRPYAPASGPAIPTAGPGHPLGVARMTVVSGAPASLPASVGRTMSED